MPKEPQFPTAADNPAEAAPLPESLQIADAPVQSGKLDADLYLADDLDGITESLFGSGNLNYLLLQARQTDAAATGAGFDSVNALHADPASALAALAAAQQAAVDAQAIDQALAMPVAADGDAFGAARGSSFAATSSPSGSFSAETSGTGFSLLSQGDQPLPAPPDDEDRPNDDDDDGGDDDDDDTNNPPDDDDGTNNGDIDILGDNNIGLPVIDINLDPLENIVGDIDLGIGIDFDPDSGLTIDLDTVLVDIPLVGSEINIDIPLVNPVIGEVLEVAAPVLDAVTDIAQPVIDGLSTTVESLLGSLLGAPPAAGDDYDLAVHTDLGIPDLDVNLDVIENIVGDIDIGVTFSHGEDGIGLGIETIAADLPLVNADVQLDIPLATPVVNGALDPAADLLGTITDPETLSGVVDDPLGSLPALADAAIEGIGGIVEGTVSGVGDSLGNALGNLGQPDNTADDYDIALYNDLGLPQIDVNLDLVESVTGDIDLGTTLSHGDEGLTVGLDTVLAGVQVFDDAEVTLDIPLVTPVADDVLDMAQSLLGAASDDENTASGAMTLIDGLAQNTEDTLSNILGSSSEDPLWPQLGSGLLDGTVDSLGSLVDSTGDGALQLPEPVGNIVEGLGLLPSGSEHGGGVLSGLFNGHGGGLFG